MIRIAQIHDIPQIQLVRNAVLENRLSNPLLVTDEDCRIYLSEKGKGWVAIEADRVVGFAIVDLAGQNIWALFVQPGFDQQGIGRKLHNTMLDWYFEQRNETVWLSTAPNTRAATFYRMSGWQEAGTYGKGELRFEMTADSWKECRRRDASSKKL